MIDKVPFLRHWWAKASERAFIEHPIPEEELTEVMARGAQPTLVFYLLLALAGIIATCGLLSNSVGVIIGAMIVAPLMNPILTLSYSASRADWRTALLATGTLLSGVLLTVGISYSISEVVGLRIVGSEVLGRATPNLLDLGVAFAAGLAAAYANSRRSIANALPGTAIAVALVPPLCVVGIGLSVGRDMVAEAGLGFIPLEPGATGNDVASGAALLFLANLAGIIFIAELVFVLQGYGTLRKGALGLALTVAATLSLVLPLGLSLRTLHSKSVAMGVASSMAKERAATGKLGGTILTTRVFYAGETLTIDIKLLAPESLSGLLRERADIFQREVESRLNESVVLNVIAIFTPMEQYSVGAPAQQAQ
ncbi:MAG: putative hydrophobic protein (TIGR00271 family) [Candidatus Paceibacteria bacterium]|jgi:uncharacterized hydrophobic protein (TIGR00271 family)